MSGPWFYSFCYLPDLIGYQVLLNLHLKHFQNCVLLPTPSFVPQSKPVSSFTQTTANTFLTGPLSTLVLWSIAHKALSNLLKRQIRPIPFAGLHCPWKTIKQTQTQISFLGWWDPLWPAFATLFDFLCLSLHQPYASHAHFLDIT